MISKTYAIAAVLWIEILSGACGRATPTAADRQLHPSLFEGMRLVVTPATVQLLLANGVPYTSAAIYWFSTRPTVAGLFPMETSYSKLVLAFAPDTVTIWVDAYVAKTRRPRALSDYYHAGLTSHLVILPDSQVISSRNPSFCISTPGARSHRHVETLRPLLDWPLAPTMCSEELKGALRSTFDEPDFVVRVAPVYEVQHNRRTSSTIRGRRAPHSRGHSVAGAGTP
jgi:hypothetical protein